MTSNFRNFIQMISLLMGILILGQSTQALAKKKLDEINAVYKKNTTSSFKFQIQTPNLNQNKPQIGLYYQQNEKYLLKIMSAEQLYDGKKLHIINNDEKEVSIAKTDNSSQALSPMSVLSKYKSGYSISFSKNNTIILKPSKNEGIKEIEIFFDSKTNKIISIKQFDLNGDVSVLKVLNYKSNPKLNPSMFVYNKKLYGNYIVTEL